MRVVVYNTKDVILDEVSVVTGEAMSDIYVKGSVCVCVCSFACMFVYVCVYVCIIYLHTYMYAPSVHNYTTYTFLHTHTYIQVVAWTG